ncbi:hypothetical protein [Planctomyces sp. SH-PL14]|uniref:hypothetical protein n=1 Tax=Planctomyces sp. SH-PL14 TaxID=1632864 RepID=UPI0012E8F88D|nr:hypothetical protein [Planctomyces sp. SH-PL14]
MAKPFREESPQDGQQAGEEDGKAQDRVNEDADAVADVGDRFHQLAQPIELVKNLAHLGLKGLHWNPFQTKEAPAVRRYGEGLACPVARYELPAIRDEVEARRVRVVLLTPPASFLQLFRVADPSNRRQPTLWRQMLGDVSEEPLTLNVRLPIAATGPVTPPVLTGDFSEAGPLPPLLFGDRTNASIRHVAAAATAWRELVFLPDLVR